MTPVRVVTIIGTTHKSGTRVTQCTRVAGRLQSIQWWVSCGLGKQLMVSEADFKFGPQKNLDLLDPAPAVRRQGLVSISSGGTIEEQSPLPDEDAWWTHRGVSSGGLTTRTARDGTSAEVFSGAARCTNLLSKLESAMLGPESLLLQTVRSVPDNVMSSSSA